MGKNTEPGDYVEVHLMKTIYEGVLLEVPKSEKGIVLLKLDSGYNIGFNKKEVSYIKVLKKAKEKLEEVKIEKDSKKPDVAMVITGGTIASKLDPKTGAVKWLDTPESLFKIYPELFEKVNISKVKIPFMKGSENMDFKDWKKIAKVVQKLLNEMHTKGVIITHGTDSLHYTSAALSFFLGKVNKPVVLTYSQRSIDRASSDASLNLQCAALAAISDIAEVMIVGHASSNDDFCYAMSGTKVRKLHSSRRDAFKVVNSKPFAKISKDTIHKLSDYNVRNKSHSGYPKTLNKGAKIKADLSFEDKVALLKFYPGQNPDILDYYFKKKYKGVVIEMMGLGHVAAKESNLSWTKKLKEVIEKGLVVCAAAQTIYGRLDPLVYSTGRELLNTGIIYLEDMLAETALVKLGFVLGHPDWNVKEKMLENISGEFNDRLEG